MFKKIVGVIVLAGCFAFLAPQGASAQTATPVATVVEGDKEASGIVERINARAASDKEYAGQLSHAITEGDTKALAELVASEGGVELGGENRRPPMINCFDHICVVYIYDSQGRLIAIIEIHFMVP